MKNISLKNVKKILNKKIILQNINLETESNEVLAIMGYSGSGKTTLLNLMSGLDKPTSGEIIINDQNIVNLKEPSLTKFRSKNISFIFQDYKLIDYLTIEENICLTKRINNEQIDKNKLKEVIDNLELSHLLSNKINQISGGQKQRVAIARAIIGNNSFIFADEPTGALDLITREKIIELLIKNSKIYSKTLIVVTHDPYVGSKADRVIFMSNQTIESINQKMTITQIETKMKELYTNE